MSSVRSGEATETDRHVPQCFRFVLIFQLHFIQCSVSFATSQRSSTSLSVCFGVSEILVGGMKAKLYFLSVLLGISTGTPVSGFFWFFLPFDLCLVESHADATIFFFPYRKQKPRWSPAI